MHPPSEFEIEGVTFYLAPLNPLTSADLLQAVFELLPDLQAAKQAEDSGNATQALLAGARMMRHVVKFAPEFRKVCKAKMPPVANVPVPLDGIFDRVFEREQSRLIAWVMQCVQLEYASFLAKAFRAPEPEPEPASS